MVANEDESLDGVALADGRRTGQQSNDAGFQYLTSLVDDGKREITNGKYERTSHERCSSAHNDGYVLKQTPDGVEVWRCCHQAIQQVWSEDRVTTIFAAMAYKRQSGITEHATDFVNGSVRVGHEQDGGLGLWFLGVRRFF